ncbi:MAG: YicC family protein [Clostridiaceae bacterium]|nr:YicC family protein [Clostridiaceae bacterium]
MLKSMTGFGRGEAQHDERYFNIEFKSVNHRYMDISIKMPKSFTYLEENIRQVVKQYVKRGRVEVFISYKNLGESDIKVVPNVTLANEYLSALKKIEDSLDITSNIETTTLARFSDVLQLEKQEEDEELIWNLLKQGLHDALENLLTMRVKEGEKLKEDLLQRLNTLVQLLEKIEDRSPVIVTAYKEKLTKRIKEILDEDIQLDEQRIAMEVALFADKSSITEEIVRFNSHINQFKEAMEEETVGRKLDFLIQEMNREVNTIGSKANDLIISNIVVDIKSELEKIREQVQNIE